MSFSQRPRSGGRRGFSQSNGPSRPSPYQRTNADAPTVEGQWQHDLFGRSSDLYRPSVNVNHLSRIIPGAHVIESASLRPFGDATPAPTRLISTASDPAPAPVAPQAPAAESNDIVNRFGIRGSSNQVERERIEQQRNAKAERIRIEREKREQVRARKLLEKTHAAQMQVATQEETGFVVQVEGLVYGTSREDVQTAFGSYGEIRYCFIVDEDLAREGDVLVARITFSRHEDAKTACHKLDGAIADGRPLTVRSVPRSPFPPQLPAHQPSSAARTVTREFRIDDEVVIVTEPEQVAPPSKMYADTIVEAYAAHPPPRPKSAPDAMEVDRPTTAANTLNSPIPTGPRKRNAAKSSATGSTNNGPPPSLGARLGVLPQQQTQNSLLQRVGGGAGQPAPARGAAGKKGNSQPQALSLAERMAQPAGGRAGSGGGAAQGSKKGTANGSSQKSGGSSLLDRLK
ncbi:RNA recognition motif domain-containing protein [Sporobolomyces koalae]|uniref:RNA recognition motif domain-containing protein n=1 Tax=Sporobolomyces koalae TaxID=500713 RepID=UPI00316C72AE